MPIEIGQRPDHGFDEPLGLLNDCHRRIERFLGAMLSVSRNESGRPLGAEGRGALEKASTYFRMAAPKHTADEEENLFPLLRAAALTGADGIAGLLDDLEAEHRDAETAQARVDELVARWLALEDAGLPDAQARELVERLESLQRDYTDHIRREDEQVFPAAAQLLAPHQLEDLGRRMAERRDVPYRGPIARFLGADHESLHGWLEASLRGGAHVDLDPFHRFRAGILRHIALEEKLLIPRATEAAGGDRPTVAEFLRVDHSAIAALLVPTPTPKIVAELRSILAHHDLREEEAGGLYDVCDRALGAQAALRLVDEMTEHPPVKLKAYNDGPRVARHMWQSVDRAREAWTEWPGPENG